MKRLAPKLLLFVCLAAALYAAVWGGYRWLQGRVDAFLGPTTARTGVGAETAARPVSDAEAIKTILARNIFAASLDGPPPVDFNLNDLAANAGPVELLGTVTGSGGAARAIIRSGPEGKERLYRIGERVQGAEIVAIERGRVELAGAGGRETLTIKARQRGRAALRRPHRGPGKRREHRPGSADAAARLLPQRAPIPARPPGQHQIHPAPARRGERGRRAHPHRSRRPAASRDSRELGAGRTMKGGAHAWALSINHFV